MVILLANDLMFASRFHSVAGAVGVDSQTALTPAQAIAALETGGVKAVCVDLELPGLNLIDLVTTARGCGDAAVIAYGPHVHTQRLEAAQAAGCDQVLSRGQFDRSLPELLGAFRD
jgi:CheY-like chemotaxis protein